MNLFPPWIFVGLASVTAAAATPADTCRQRSDAILAALTHGDTAAATTHFDARMHAAISADQLASLWRDTLPAQVGTFRGAGEPAVQQAAGNTLVVTPLQFQHAWLDLQVACTADGAVSGLFFRPGQAPAAAEPQSASGAATSDLATPSPFGPLPGTLLLPHGTGPFPAVLLLAGSGPQDRNETIGPNQPLRDLADALAAQGIASYRYDKRSLAYAAPMAANPRLTVDDEVTDDAVAALKVLAAQPRIDARHLFVLGHSLGALMAPRVAARAPAVAGVILLAAPQRIDIDDLVRQVRYLASVRHLPKAKLDAALKPLLSAAATLAKANPSDPPAGQFVNAPASYWLSLRDYDAIATARQLRQPMLILQGGGDYQVTPHGDFAAWQRAFAGSPRVTTHLFPGLSHLFMPAGTPPSPADYERAGHVASDVTTAIADWIKAHAKP